MTLRVEQLQSGRSGFSLGPVTITVESGTCLALMGANGAGKTTFLETLVGFVQCTSGSVSLDGRDITHEVPERRRIAYVPQDLALFPHLDVTRNIAFAVKRGGRRQLEGRIDPLIKEFGLESVSRHYPHQLSSGQAQRVAFARALAMEPAVLLLDEPTANLDLAGQRSIHASLRRSLLERGLVVIYVTHNILDGMALTDQLAILDRGRVIQTGSPDVVFHHPVDARVAAHLGITNLWPAQITDEAPAAAGVRIGSHDFFCHAQRPAPNTSVLLGIGPGEIELYAMPPADLSNTLRVVIQALQVNGQTALLELAGGLPGLRAAVPPAQAETLVVGQALWARLPADRLRLIPAAAR
ncbi:MAG TPA: ABC transporter ATP-binding protein [Rhodanobacter sp.]|nr:ABC transporter ATP-binding protein [Rhodanobacter sp.]